MVVEKPWGEYSVIQDVEGPTALVKTIKIKSGCRISLQEHEKRAEVWTIISGEGLFELGNKLEPVYPGESYIIEIGSMHRMTNVGSEDLIFTETQIGICEEDDIIRHEDDYGRN